MVLESAKKIASEYKLNLTLKNTTAFVALLFVMHELHEIAHTAVGRIICGCWGERNFNSWGLCCNDPITIIASIAGPLFTFAVIYLGYYLLSNRFDGMPGKKSLGFALVFGSLPFGRLFTALIGKGDELYELKFFFGEYLDDTVLWVMAILLVTAILFAPLYRSWQRLHPDKRWWVFTGFLLLPLVVDILVVIIGMNMVYQQGFLDQTGLMGSPIIVNIWTLLWIGVLTITWKNLKTLIIPAEQKPE